MPPIHDLQVVVVKGVDVSNSIQAVNSASNSGRMVELVKQVQEFENRMKKVKDNTKEEKVNKDGHKGSMSANASVETKKEPEKASGEKSDFDDYRGKILDIRY